MNEYLQVLKKYAVFNGRAGRKEYWMFFLFNFLIAIVISIIGALLHVGFLSTIYTLALLIPSIAVGVRRLHDTGRSGWWLLIGLVPLVGIIVLIVCLAEKSNPEENKYGSNVKGMVSVGTPGGSQNSPTA